MGRLAAVAWVRSLVAGALLIGGVARAQDPPPVDVRLSDQDGVPVADHLVNLRGAYGNGRTDANGVVRVQPQRWCFWVEVPNNPAFDLTPENICTGTPDDWDKTSKPVPPGMRRVQQGSLPPTLVDASKPVNIRVSRRHAVDLIHFWRREPQRLDGAPACVDLRRTPDDAWTTQRKGDLCVAMAATSDGACTATVEALAGGVQKVHEVYPNHAPAEGYTPSLVETLKRGGSDELWLFLRSRGARLQGRLRLHFWCIPNSSSVELEGWLNPRGESDLQFDYFHRLEPDFDHPYDDESPTPGSKCSPPRIGLGVDGNRDGRMETCAEKR